MQVGLSNAIRDWGGSPPLARRVTFVRHCVPGHFGTGKNANRLRQLLRRLTQEKLAEMAGVDRRHIQRLERGSANPGSEVICGLKAALGAEWDELMDSVGS